MRVDVATAAVDEDLRSALKSTLERHGVEVVAVHLGALTVTETTGENFARMAFAGAMVIRSRTDPAADGVRKTKTGRPKTLKGAKRGRRLPRIGP